MPWFSESFHTKKIFNWKYCGGPKNSGATKQLTVHIRSPLTCTNTHTDSTWSIWSQSCGQARFWNQQPHQGRWWFVEAVLECHDWMTIACIVSHSDHALAFTFWNVLKILEALKSQIVWNDWVSVRRCLQTLSNVTIECSLTHSTGAFGTSQRKMRFQKGRCQGNEFVRTFGSIF